MTRLVRAVCSVLIAIVILAIGVSVRFVLRTDSDTLPSPPPLPVRTVRFDVADMGIARPPSDSSDSSDSSESSDFAPSRPGPIPRHVTDDNGVFWVLRDPTEVAEVPAGIQSILQDRGCRVPTADSEAGSNVFWGELQRAKQQDLAIFCVQERKIVIYVFWGGSPVDVDTIRRDSDFIAGQAIRRATPEYIQEHLEAYGSIDSRMPSRVEHDGIEDMYLCCSTIHYRHQGRWVLAPGAD